jgi:aconitate hydratase
MNAGSNPFGTLKSLQTPAGLISIHSLSEFEKFTGRKVSDFPKTIKVLLESALRNFDGYAVQEKDIMAIAGWKPAEDSQIEIPFKPARVVLQDFTGVPVVVDLAAMREACISLGGDPGKINPLVPCDLVIDHSVQVDYFARPDAMKLNLDMEFQRNRERYAFLKWGQQAFDNFSVVPPGRGIVHQVNLEHFACVVREENGLAYPDSLVGTDSHTTMINGLGVAGWGVGGIEAEAVMLGQPVYMLLPRVTGFRLTGRLRKSVTATDLVLTVTQQLRMLGVVGDFIEFFGPGVGALSLPDRATIANMAPEYGATMGFFPVDRMTIEYLSLTGRGALCPLVETYCREQGLWLEDVPMTRFTRIVGLDLDSVEPSIAGPKRPHDRIPLAMAPSVWRKDIEEIFGKCIAAGNNNGTTMENEGGGIPPAGCAEKSFPPEVSGVEVSHGGNSFFLKHGSVVIAAITSCTNTSNPSLMIAAGMIAREAVRRGMKTRPWVKTSMAPGSRVVTDYLDAAGLSRDLDELGFSTVGYGCTTCIGNSGPLPDIIAEAVNKQDLVVCAVLSGNRNFEGRINPYVKASYLVSPPLVVAYALAGRIDIDFLNEPLGMDSTGKKVFLSDLLPSEDENAALTASALDARQFAECYRTVTEGTSQWSGIDAPAGSLYVWDDQSTYIRKPPFFENMLPEALPIEPVRGARCLALLGDSISTDHISPAGAINSGRPAGQYLLGRGVDREDFNSFGSRRGNHEVMIRGTFDNIRVKNQLVPGKEGGVTLYFGLPGQQPELLSIYDAAIRYQSDHVPLIVLAGNDYGMGSSRDWAAKGTLLLGVRAVIASSFERIHRSNLVGMGVLPLQFMKGVSAQTLGLSGKEVFDVVTDDSLSPGQALEVVANDTESGIMTRFPVICRIDTPVETDYYRHGGILPAVLRKIVHS